MARACEPRHGRTATVARVRSEQGKVAAAAWFSARRTGWSTRRVWTNPEPRRVRGARTRSTCVPCPRRRRGGRKRRRVYAAGHRAPADKAGQGPTADYGGSSALMASRQQSRGWTGGYGGGLTSGSGEGVLDAVARCGHDESKQCRAAWQRRRGHSWRRRSSSSLRPTASRSSSSSLAQWRHRIPPPFFFFALAPSASFSPTPSPPSLPCFSGSSGGWGKADSG